MAERLRVPMRQTAKMFAPEDVAACIERGPSFATRFSLDVAEEALAQMGREAMPFIVEKLAEGTIHREGHVIEAAVRDQLYNKREWLEKIIEDETRKVVQSFMRDTLAGWVERMESNALFWRELSRRYSPNDSEQQS